jgi:hypothetical protein
MITKKPQHYPIVTYAAAQNSMRAVVDAVYGDAMFLSRWDVVLAANEKLRAAADAHSRCDRVSERACLARAQTLLEEVGDFQFMVAARRNLELLIEQTY